MNKQFIKLQAAYIKAVHDIVILFCEKQGYEPSPLLAFSLVSPDVIDINDFFFNIDDIFLDLSEEVPKGVIQEHYELSLERYNKGLESTGYARYLDCNREIDPDKAVPSYALSDRMKDKMKLFHLKAQLKREEESMKNKK